MLRIAAETELKPEVVVRKALGFFGPSGNHMKVLEQTEKCISFEGAGGGVWVTAQSSGAKTSVEVVTQEWEEPVKEFMRRIKEN